MNTVARSERSLTCCQIESGHHFCRLVFRKLENSAQSLVLSCSCIQDQDRSACQHEAALACAFALTK
jgi:hypothetical protein